MADKIIFLQDSNSEQLIKSNLLTELQLLLEHFHEKISRNAQQIRDIKTKKEYAKAKFIERGGQDWRNGKFVYVISAIHAFLYDINCFLKKHETVLQQICEIRSQLHCSDLYSSRSEISLEGFPNYVPLIENYTTENPSFIKQRTEKWFELRKKAKVTGSTIYKALGMDTLKKQKEYFDHVICGVPEKSASATQLSNMKYGTENEVNGIATLVSRIMPVAYPQLQYFEEGCFEIKDENKPFMVVSPDGSLGKISDENQNRHSEVAVEIKCPMSAVHKEIPVRYYLQCLAEMEVIDVSKLVFVSWTPTTSTAFEIQRNKPLFKKSLDIVKDIYCCENSRKPSKLSRDILDMKKQIADECRKAKFMGEFLSASNVDIPSTTKVCNVEDQQYTTETNGTNFKLIANVSDLLTNLCDIVNESYELQRQKASEAIVFLCCDLDRNWSKNPFRWAPVCWFPKGYSISTVTVRKVLEQVHTECHKAGIHIPAVSFDGQWHNIVTRSASGKPITIYQLQKDVWQEAERTSKSDIIKVLSDLGKAFTWTTWTKEEGTTSLCEYPEYSRVTSIKRVHKSVWLPEGERVPFISLEAWNRIQKKNLSTLSVNDSESETSIPSTLLLDHVPIEVIQRNEHMANEKTNSDVLSHVTTDNDLAEELQSCNVDNDAWKTEIQHMQELQEVPIQSEDFDLSPIFSSENTVNDGGESPMESVNDDVISSMINTEESEHILAMLRTNKSTNTKNQWTDISSENLLEKCSTVKGLLSLRDVDLRIIARYLSKTRGVKIRESDRKNAKVDHISELLGLDLNSVVLNKTDQHRKQKKVKSLKDLTLSALSTKVPKQVLNKTFAEYIWPDRLAVWKSQMSVREDVTIGDLTEQHSWFYYPEFSSAREQLEVRCIDSTHMLTRARRKCCKGGIENLDNKPWIKVALQKTTFLSLAMVEDVADPMSASMALTHFSEAVENEMLKNGDFRAASLCNDIRSWWKAEDDPGIPALQRIKMRLSLRKRLLAGIDFATFPPKVMYIKGWPAQLWEALISNIDAKTFLYSLCKKNAYNVRAFKQYVGETFFAELTNQDKSGHGTVTVDNFSFFLGCAVEQMQTRLDSER
ncbi:unnamed protein product [Mytilus edulis]|uniref:YqaJ viral recombinase domain-containing protein n=1 Tax=Mytilus edulis TaxID=6550 RepID=A0A8S3SLP5_MYTED|nr:unnamed protein product [Mytilus edulis]